MSWRFDMRLRLRCRKGQATVEAAVLIPVMFAALLILLQPAMLLFGRVVMQHAASEGCRYLLTASGADADAEAYVLRHLAAIPDVAVLHDGEWEVSVSADCESVTVRIVHGVKPLPVIGAFVGAVGATDAQGRMVQEVSCTMPARAGWISACDAGCDPQAWVQRWEEAA